MLIVMMVIVVLGLLIGLVVGFFWIRRLLRRPRMSRVPIDDDYEVAEAQSFQPLGTASWKHASVAPSIYEGKEGDKEGDDGLPESGNGNDNDEEQQGLVATDLEASSESRRSSISRPLGPRKPVPRMESRKSIGGYSPVSLYNKWRS